MQLPIEAFIVMCTVQYDVYDVYDVYDDGRRYTNATNTPTSDIMKEMVSYNEGNGIL